MCLSSLDSVVKRKINHWFGNQETWTLIFFCWFVALWLGKLPYFSDSIFLFVKHLMSLPRLFQFQDPVLLREFWRSHINGSIKSLKEILAWYILFTDLSDNWNLKKKDFIYLFEKKNEHEWGVRVGVRGK